MAISMEGSLDNLIIYAQNHNILTIPSKDESSRGCHVPYHKNTVVVPVGKAKFAMHCHSHDTGNSVVVYILGGEKPYEILNGTYWKRSGYDHNTFKHEHGAWDVAFQEAIDTLRHAIIAHKDVVLAERLADVMAKEAKALQEKQAIEQMFQ